jgi:HAD superfamily hydrolase (TIGR01549 family)
MKAFARAARATALARPKTAGPRPRPRAVLFDWDGTLLDSAELSYRCYVRLFGRFGIGYGRDDFARTYSPDWTRTYVALGLPRERWAEADHAWLALYKQDAAELLAGAGEALATLADSGMLLGIVSSGDRDRVTAEIARLGLAGRFATVVCGNDVSNRKPHPEGLRLALDRIGALPEVACYVGDSPEDIEMARAAGVFSIGIPGGFPNEEALRGSRPDRLLGSLSEAVAFLKAC